MREIAVKSADPGKATRAPANTPFLSIASVVLPQWWRNGPFELLPTSPWPGRLDAERQRSVYAAKGFGQRQSFVFFPTLLSICNERDIVRTPGHRHETFRNLSETNDTTCRQFETQRASGPRIPKRRQPPETGGITATTSPDRIT
jgi:hypothetical protein